ncbi:hypothetical protein L2Y96_04510 [Luteibacter aegosomaticola]|uniref:hypothetical protein n=1 Tax=Luteibacter aegosomaticola TaxID=2911538 RepID=UPI001FF7E5E4|nr:hypothetical protein [Luteibacter aegosomaticola]UPG91048.1 hypothetical protein L2Y96_04510 [Luteibacter aegosomaticola]
MTDDMEDWLIEVGDYVIQKKANVGLDGLSTIEVAIYAMWVVDYSVRNSGTLFPMTELYPEALEKLAAFAADNHLEALNALASAECDDEAYGDVFYQWFELATLELKHLHSR